MTGYFEDADMNKFLGLLILLSSLSVADVAVIVHPQNVQAFDKSSISRLFLGKDRTFANKETAFLFALPESSPATLEFNNKVLDKSAKQLKSHWSRLVFTGKGVPPNEMASDIDVINEIKHNVNAIGYVDVAAVTKDVKVVAVF
jgi:ABC-type phosphate transport system substrate-binding protein